MTWLWASALLLGCLDQEGFERDFSSKYCDLLEDCNALATYGYRHRRECDENATVTGKSCSFDSDLGEQCLESLSASTCEDLSTSDIPTSCLEVCG